MYGWNYDLYEIGSVAISTGYRSIGESVDYTILRQYEEQAEKIVKNYDMPHKEKEKKVNSLLSEYICITTGILEPIVDTETIEKIKNKVIAEDKSELVA